MVMVELIIFVASLVILVLGSDYFVKGAAAIAEKLGISEFMIGLTLVAIGTSIPELAASIIAAFANEPGIVIGDIVGSNIANIALIIGVTATIVSIKTEEKMLIRDGYIMMFVTVIFYIAMTFGVLTRVTSVIFLVLYVAYIIFLFETRGKERDEYHFKAFIRYFYRFRYLRTIHAHILEEVRKARNKEPVRLVAVFKSGVVKDLLMVIVSGAGIYIGAKYLVEEAVFFAYYLGVPKSAIGVSLVAFGTSVPELSVVLTAARKGYGNIAVGNIIGSNIANILLVGGVSALIIPITIGKLTMLFTAPFMIIASLMLLFFIKSDWKIHRIEGLAFIAVYLIFMLILFFTRNSSL